MSVPMQLMWEIQIIFYLKKANGVKAHEPWKTSLWYTCSLLISHILMAKLTFCQVSHPKSNIIDVRSSTTSTTSI